MPSYFSVDLTETLNAQDVKRLKNFRELLMTVINSSVISAEKTKTPTE